MVTMSVWQHTNDGIHVELRRSSLLIKSRLLSGMATSKQTPRG